MRKVLIIVPLLGVAWLLKEANRNPLWKYQFKPTPKSVPEVMVEEGRLRGWL